MKKIIQGIIAATFLSGCQVTSVVPNALQEKAFLSKPGYEQIDKHALRSPKHLEHSSQTLAAYLIEPAKNDREKARAIYRWITYNIAYNDEGFFKGKTGDLSPDGVLRNRRAVCEGYAGLFKRLGQLAGLEVETISGYSKGYSYAVDGNDSINHAWNAVKIDGQWQLIDTTWGAGYLDEKKKRFIRLFQDHYFLTPPEQFIYDHFPKQTRWQLQQPPISKADYDRQVYLRPAFFRTGLLVGSHPQGTIKTQKEVMITLRAPKEAALMGQLLLNHNEVDESHISIRKRVGQYEILTTFPRPGKYTLRLFTKRQDEEGAYRWALDYRIIASQGITSEEKAVSPEQIFFDTGLKVDSHPQRFIETEKEVMVTILAPENVLMSAILYHDQKRLDKSFTFVQRKGEKYEIHAVYPRPGNYILRLFAKHKNEEDYQQALDYNVKVNQGLSGNIGFPKTFVPFKEKKGYLYTPMQAHLKAGTTQQFRLAIEAADKVAVLIENKWHPLKKQGGLFEGNVTIGKGKFSVYAKWPGDRNYSSLLQYVAE
ncbi:MAG: hypothetical protein KAI83_06820 [Thiomargarita sp.]|nr:hypothetical protein [Thiomargarita sp.]